MRFFSIFAAAALTCVMTLPVLHQAAQIVA